jgi:hypothetical protein
VNPHQDAEVLAAPIIVHWHAGTVENPVIVPVVSPAPAPFATESQLDGPCATTAAAELLTVACAYVVRGSMTGAGTFCEMPKRDNDVGLNVPVHALTDPRTFSVNGEVEVAVYCPHPLNGIVLPPPGV